MAVLPRLMFPDDSCLFHWWGCRSGSPGTTGTLFTTDTSTYNPTTSFKESPTLTLTGSPTTVSTTPTRTHTSMSMAPTPTSTSSVMNTSATSQRTPLAPSSTTSTEIDSSSQIFSHTIESTSLSPTSAEGGMAPGSSSTQSPTQLSDMSTLSWARSTLSLPGASALTTGSHHIPSPSAISTSTTSLKSNRKTIILCVILICGLLVLLAVLLMWRIRRKRLTRNRELGNTFSSALDTACSMALLP